VWLRGEKQDLWSAKESISHSIKWISTVFPGMVKISKIIMCLSSYNDKMIKIRNCSGKEIVPGV
jgi:hypothetical protein